MRSTARTGGGRPSFIRSSQLMASEQPAPCDKTELSHKLGAHLPRRRRGAGSAEIR